MARRTLLFAGLLLLLLSSMHAAKAQLALTISPDALTGAPGDILTFFGTLTNNGATTLFINSDSPNLIGTGLTLDDTPFFTNAPSTLNPGDTTGSIALFSVTVDSGALSGSYPGQFSIIGGASSSSQDTLATGSFTVVVGPAAPPPSANTPEPGNGALLAGLLTSGGCLLACRKRRIH